MSTKSLPDDIRGMFLFFVLSLAAHGLAYSALNILSQGPGPLPEGFSRVSEPIAVDVIDEPLMGLPPLPHASREIGKAGADDAFERPGATSAPLSGAGHEGTAPGAPHPEDSLVSGPDAPDRATAGGGHGETTAGGSGAARPAGKKPNLFLPEQRLAELSREYEKESPKEEQGKTLQLNTSELRYQKYLVGLKNRIELFWEYPAPAIKNGWQGILQIDFTVNKDGRLDSVRFMKSSNYPVLDDAAQTALKLAEPFAPFPENFGVESISIHGQFEYRFINAPAER